MTNRHRARCHQCHAVRHRAELRGAMLNPIGALPRLVMVCSDKVACQWRQDRRQASASLPPQLKLRGIGPGR